jgi:hypothetical protein
VEQREQNERRHDRHEDRPHASEPVREEEEHRTALPACAPPCETILRTMRLARPAAVDPPRPAAYVHPRRGTELQRARPRDCKARRSEAATLLRERRSGEHPAQLGTASSSCPWGPRPARRRGCALVTCSIDR